MSGPRAGAYPASRPYDWFFVELRCLQIASATTSACEPCAVSSCAEPVRRNVSGAFLKLSEFDSCTRYRRMRPVVQYDSVVKDQFGTGSGLGYPQRPEPHVPSYTVGKTGGVSGEKPIHCAADIVFTQCFQGRKNLSLFSACPRMSVLGRRCRSMSARRAKP